MALSVHKRLIITPIVFEQSEMAGVDLWIVVPKYLFLEPNNLLVLLGFGEKNSAPRVDWNQCCSD